MPDDQHLHACALVYLSDMGTGFAKSRGAEPAGGPSLDHAIWLHRPTRLDEWVLVDLEPVTAAGTRAYYTGAVFAADGTLVASISQEHVMRPFPPELRELIGR
jgi:acyl-CoA thioesterase-2